MNQGGFPKKQQVLIPCFVLGSFYHMERFTNLIFFWEAPKILSVLNARMILVFTFKLLVEEKNKYKDWLAFSKTLTNTKDWPESHVIISLPASLSVIGQFSSVSTPYWMREKFA